MDSIPFRICTRTRTSIPPTSIHTLTTIIASPPSAGQPSQRAPEHAFPPNVHPNAALTPEKPVFSHLSDEKLGQGGFWRQDDGDGMGHECEREHDRDRERDRDRELQLEREREKRASMDIMHGPATTLHGHTSSGAVGYECIMPSPFPPASPRHQSQRHEPWDDTQPPRPSMGSPSRLPPPHSLSHPSHQSSLGSLSVRHAAPSSPPQGAAVA
ncbi:hypothetical protein JB92DRAFT_3108670 [Gautieria morchelliformis]|nr:hypothetical protein JB92DRAFT_3108670 [Gautieria morchelliformis]